ncbi:MAG: choice-of-anchor D domain-containing protein [bacterium]
MTPKFRLTLASILAVAALGAIAPAANAYVYWANFTNNTIGRANLDGSSPNQSFITSPYPGAVGLALGGNYIYWANTSFSGIGLRNLTNFYQSFITLDSSPMGVAVDGNYIYWANYFGIPATIGRANLDGTGVNQSFITGAYGPWGVAVDSLGPAGSLSPSSSAFGSWFVSAGLSPAASFTLVSNGNDDLTIPENGINLTGTDPDQFQVTGGTCSAGSTSLAQDQSCTVTVAFDPSSLGSKSATLDVQTNDGLKSVALTGTGTPIPTISGAGKPTKTSLKVKVGCGDANTCTLQFTGKKVGTNAAITPKTVFVPAGQQPTVTLAYSRTL